MVQQTINELEEKTLWIESKGDLELVGTTETYATVTVDREEDLTVDVSPDRITLYCEGEMEIMAPAGTNVHITKAHSDAAVRFWTGMLEVDGVGGDLVIEQAASIEAKNVGSDCAVLDVPGQVLIHNVGSDFSGRGLTGDVKVDHVGSDFNLTGAVGNVSVTAGSDIRLALAQLSGQTILLRAGSDVRVQLPADPDVKIRAISGGQTVKVGLGTSHERYETGIYEATFGSGAASLEITAGSDITITDEGDRSAQSRERGSRLEDRISRKTEKALRKAENQLSRAERLAERSTQRSEEAVRRAQERVQAAMRRLEARRQGRPAGSDPAGAAAFSGGNLAGSSSSQEPAGATEEERMLILQMLQEKKITVEEADRLLAVLEGQQE